MNRKSARNGTAGIPLESCCGLGAEADRLRCACGSLLARVVEGGVELKCRRCKRTMILKAEPLPTAAPPEANVGPIR